MGEVKLNGKIKAILKGYVKDNKKCNGGWIIISLSTKTPTELVTNDNETVIIDKFPIKPIESRKIINESIIAIFMENIPEDFDAGKDVELIIKIK